MIIKDVTIHHDGHGLNESIVIQADEAGPGGASHRYEFWIDGELVGFLQMQKGPRNEPGSTPGLTEAAVLATVIDRLTDFQAGPYPSEEGATALLLVTHALEAIRSRADARAQRGVLGKAEA